MGMLLYSLLALVAGVTSVLACSCGYSHPQDTFCSVDFVFLGWLRSNVKETEPNGSMTKKYEVTIRKVFKARPNDFGFNENMTVGILYTASHDSLCGVEFLEKRVKFLFTGSYVDSQLNIDICTTIGSYGQGPMPWAWVSKMQRKYLNRIYRENCECVVFDTSPYAYNSPHSSNSTCKWDSRGDHSECYERQTACIKDRKSHLGDCKWHNNPKMKACKQTKSSGFLEP
ncbi:TIMP3-like protein [Mya arenaria]|uniref:TIMP3-like protein n=1 Tax=Mya arenaria TaxID=6604 RepID=A0ABY7FSA6_MYAAR|nr:metalloproteinase inhibitor 3-like [Mya arenaria]XP_052779681.1 metalloproteinase inhibitor 3-like [Mya arenaria]XP_052779682.1 metalloproteinase inhibitor 3-like [Mya arenaria]WAR25042.1 TIMP3-like protein [Mya arenaria]